MSEKQAKINRKEKPKIVIQLTINAMSDGSVRVLGFSNNMPQTMKILQDGQSAVVRFFIDKARAGQMNDQHCVEKGKIKVVSKMPRLNQ